MRTVIQKRLESMQRRERSILVLAEKERDKLIGNPTCDDKWLAEFKFWSLVMEPVCLSALANIGLEMNTCAPKETK